jgi:hypothetical protein
MSQDPALHRFFHKQEPTIDYLAQRIEELRGQLVVSDPEALAWRTASTYRILSPGRGAFELDVWDRAVRLTFPEFTARYADTDESLDTLTLAMLAYYFHTADGTPQSGSWISFADLPGGRFYAQAFQGYSGHELAKVFGNDAAAFERSALELGGRRESWGDSSFSFLALPKVSLLAVCWLGDEDFPPSYRILFDGAAGSQLTTDACAVLGSRLAGRLIKAATPV